MKKFRTEYFIAKGLSNAGASRAVMQKVATVSVAVSVCVMIIAMAVIYGFKSEILSKLEILGSDVKIVAIDSRGQIETIPIIREQKLEQSLSEIEEVSFFAPYAQKGGIFKKNSTLEGVILKGVDSLYDFSTLATMLVEGDLPRVGGDSRYKDLLISRSMAQKMQANVGDRVELVFIDENNQPRKDKYAVKGIYSSDLQQVDQVLCVTDIRNVQKLNSWADDEISGYEIKSDGRLGMDEFADKVFFALLEARSAQGLVCYDLRDSFPMIFDWLAAHDVNGAVIIGIMLIVAIFNMISALLIILLERTSMIGVLKALGMRSDALQRIFLLKSAKIVLRGMLWGNVIGLAMCLIQKYFGVVTLDADGYFLSVVPIAISFWWVVLLNVCAFVVISLVMMLPTRIILNIKPDITLRYK